MIVESFKAKIYGWYMAQEMKRIVPDWSNTDESHETREERGFEKLGNTVPIIVPVANELGVEYGSRIDMVTPTVASEMCEGYRKSMVIAREKLAETRFWLKAAKRVIFWLSMSALIFLLLVML